MEITGLAVVIHMLLRSLLTFYFLFFHGSDGRESVQGKMNGCGRMGS